jgi:hypothetical protein
MMSLSEIPMTLRHTAALALVGWYLMVPGIHDEMELSTWATRGNFDSAAQCDAAAAKLSADGAAVVAKLQKSGVPQEIYASSVAERDEAARCIAADDPRLKGK